MLTGTEEPVAISFYIDEIAVIPEKQTSTEQGTGFFRKNPVSHTEVTFGQKWLLIAGVIITVLGVGWFLKYSFDQNWIGPAGRVALAYLGGIAFLAGGELFRRRDFGIFGLYLIGGGIAILYFATFAAFQIYHLLPNL